MSGARRSARTETLSVDLRQLTGIDNAGRDLLGEIQRAGACLVVEGVWMTALIGELSRTTYTVLLAPTLPHIWSGSNSGIPTASKLMRVRAIQNPLGEPMCRETSVACHAKVEELRPTRSLTGFRVVCPPRFRNHSDNTTVYALTKERFPD